MGPKHLARILISRDLPLFERTFAVYFPPPDRPEAWNKIYLDHLSAEELEEELEQGRRLADLAEDSERWRQQKWEPWWRSLYPKCVGINCPVLMQRPPDPIWKPFSQYAR